MVYWSIQSYKHMYRKSVDYSSKVIIQPVIEDQLIVTSESRFLTVSFPKENFLGNPGESEHCN